ITVLWFERISGTTFDQTLTVINENLLVDAAFLISSLTSPTTVLAVMILAGLFATYEHHANIWWLFSGLLFFTTAVSSLLKQLLALPRPDTALIHLTSYGFPSTHAAVATVLFVVGVWFFTWLKGRKDTGIVLLASLAWLTICTSRIILNVHSFSDVLAGILLGLSIGVVAVSVAPQIFNYFRINNESFK
ncbi:MAG: phosphatase PAP2 family protein, partial [Candidatus Paceibacterota bacterium]